MGQNFDPAEVAVWIVPIALLALLVFSVRVFARDARRRGKPPVLVCLIIFCSFPLGLLAWLLFRPEPIDDAGDDNDFRLDDHRLQ